MSWLRIDDRLFLHPKWAATPASARGLWITALSYCGTQFTDGFIARPIIAILGGTQEDADALVRSGLWHEEGDGWRVHDYLEFNQSAEDAKLKSEELSRIRSEAGKAGGQRSGEARRSKAEPASKQNRSKPEAKGQQNEAPEPEPVGEGTGATRSAVVAKESPLPPPPESPDDSEGRLPTADPAARRLYEAFRAERFPKAIPTDWSRAELSRDLPYLRIWVREGLTCEKVRLLVAEARRRQFPSITVKAISENITDLLEDALAPPGRAASDSPVGPAYRVVTPAMMAAAHSRPDDGPDPETFVPGWVK